MALGKRTLVMVIIGVLVLAVGVGGGLYVGLVMFGGKNTSGEAGEIQIQNPGPMVDLGQFTATLSDPQVHVVKLKITAELDSVAVMERLIDPGWVIMIKDEIIKTLKDQRYDDVRYTEGMETLKQDMRARLNAILPRVAGQLAVRRVLFDEYMTQ
ncbi:MAG: flagellar basal body-associated FliL family protein [Synergistaceae bacterium]|jgi:flagellar FliL protein|nr:flagellar basal body-associated FliL family protein [Synergistaceae bacterium]